MGIIDTMRTPVGDAHMRRADIDPDANPVMAALTAMILPEAQCLVRALPPNERGCSFPGRFDREDTSRSAGFGPAPGEGECDYPVGCKHIGSAEMRCPCDLSKR